MGRCFWYGSAAGGLCALMWGGQAVVTRVGVLNGLTTADMTVVRYVVGGAVLLPLALRQRPFPVGQLGWRRALALVTLAGAPYTMVVVGGLAFAPALHSSVVTFGLIPIAATAFAYTAFGEHPTWHKVACLALIVTGLVMFGGNSLGVEPGGSWSGYLLFAVAATMWAAFTTLAELWSVDAIRTTATITVLSLVSLPFWITLWPMHLPRADWGMIALQAGYLGLLVGPASTYLYTRAIALLGSVRASVFVALVPPVTALMSGPVLGEQPSVSEVVGMVVVVVGVVLALRT